MIVTDFEFATCFIFCETGLFKYLKNQMKQTLLTYFLNNFEFKVIFLERKYVSCLTNLTVLDLFWNYKVVTCRSIIQHDDQGRPVQQGPCCTGSPCAEVIRKTECPPARVKMMDGRKEGRSWWSFKPSLGLVIQPFHLTCMYPMLPFKFKGPTWFCWIFVSCIHIYL